MLILHITSYMNSCCRLTNQDTLLNSKCFDPIKIILDLKEDRSLLT